jgi:hypothetical protein
MIEQYIIDELKIYKEENERLKKELFLKENAQIKICEYKEVNASLIPTDTIVSRLKENGIDIQKVVDEMGIDEITNIILDYKLYKENISTNNPIIEVNNEYFELEKERYNDAYKLERKVYINLRDIIYNELSDELYDDLNSYLRSLKEEKKIEL